MAPVLEVRDLSVSYRSADDIPRPALAGVSFALMPGEILGVLGESGSGKSTLAATLLHLVAANANVTRGAVLFEDKDLLQLNSEELRKIRGRRIALIFQEPAMALHPTMRAGEQVRQILLAHNFAQKRFLNEKVRQIFEKIFLEDADRILRSYPHQLSGGQRQRVLIAQTIACSPSVIVADEPTASLDPTTTAGILGLFQEFKTQLGLAMIFITHNPALLAGFADRVMILYGGRVAELGPADTVLASPRHPYTQALFQSIPQSLDEDERTRKEKLPSIAGEYSASLQEGCCFEPRCAEKMAVCSGHAPAMTKVNLAHSVACFKNE
jgi:oligopeptide/dipeptide ABC transporter ATP-binding protein